MSDFAISQIRTYVPVVVGALVAWLTSMGLQLDAETQTGFIVALTGVTQAVYYFIVRVLEQKWSWVGVLLGSKKTPEYK